MPTLKDLQVRLLWTVHYHHDFRASPMSHKDFGHALLHVTKAAGKLAALVNDAEHGGCEFKAEDTDKYIADLVVCALRMANTCPGRTIDLERAVIERIETKNDASITEPTPGAAQKDPIQVAVDFASSAFYKAGETKLPEPVRITPAEEPETWVKLSAPYAAIGWNVLKYSAPGPVALSTAQRADISRLIENLEERVAARMRWFAGSPDKNTASPSSPLFQEGLNFGKFHVYRSDGSSEEGKKHAKCDYFVLDLQHDKYSPSALTAYADNCMYEYPHLAMDLRKVVKDLTKDQEVK